MRRWALGLLGWTLLMAQPRRGERLQSLRIAVITNALELTPEEAQAFWPVYNARDAALQKRRAAIQSQFEALRGERASLSPQAYADSVSALYFRLWEGEARVRREYHPQLQKVLPPHKVARLYMTEVRWLRRALGEAPDPYRD